MYTSHSYTHGLCRFIQIIYFCHCISKIYYLIFKFNDDNNNYRFYCLNILYWFCLSVGRIVIARSSAIWLMWAVLLIDMICFVLCCCLRSARLLLMPSALYCHVIPANRSPAAASNEIFWISICRMQVRDLLVMQLCHSPYYGGYKEESPSSACARCRCFVDSRQL